MRNPAGVWGWLGRRIDLRTTGSHLANREIYNYFKDCSIAKSHKSDGIVRHHFLSLEFMGDLKNPNGDIPHVEFSDFPKRADGVLNSDSLDSQFGQADVYYSSAVILNRHRGPGSRVRNKNNDKAGKGTRRKGQREANRAEGIDNHGRSDNHHAQEELVNEGKMIIKITWGIRLSMLDMRGIN